MTHVYNPKYFADAPDHFFIRQDTDGQPTEYLHIFHLRSSAPQSDRAFREFLISHPDAARRYGDAKKSAAKAHRDSRGAYGQAKEPIFQELLEQPHTWAGTSPT